MKQKIFSTGIFPLSVWVLIIDKFETSQQYRTMKICNKKFKELLNTEKYYQILFNPLKEDLNNYDDYDWKKIYALKSNKCSKCSKNLENKEKINLLHVKAISTRLGFKECTKIVEEIICEKCISQNMTEGNKKWEILKCTYRQIVPAGEDNLRVLFLSLNGDHVLASLNKETTKNQIIEKITGSNCFDSWRFVFFGKQLPEENDFFSSIPKNLYQEFFEKKNHFSKLLMSFFLLQRLRD